MANEKTEIKEQIISFLKKRGKEPTTLKIIQEELKISYPTLAKYLAILEAEKKIFVNDYGNIKFYYLKDVIQKRD